MRLELFKNRKTFKDREWLLTLRDPDGYLIEVGQPTMTAGPLDSYA